MTVIPIQVKEYFNVKIATKLKVSLRSFSNNIHISNILNKIADDGDESDSNQRPTNEHYQPDSGFEEKRVSYCQYYDNLFVFCSFEILLLNIFGYFPFYRFNH